jgi:hypothetical protein
LGNTGTHEPATENANFSYFHRSFLRYSTLRRQQPSADSARSAEPEVP